MKFGFLTAVVLSVIVSTSVVVAQGHGSARGQSRQGQGGAGLSAGSQGGMRPQVRGTPQQQQRYRVSQQAVHRVRKRVRAMAKLASAESLQQPQLLELNQQLVSDLQLLQQEQESLTASLSDEQRSANQDVIQNLAKSEEDLELFSEALGFELEQAEPNAAKISDDLRKLDASSRMIEKQLDGFAEDLGLD